MNVRSLSYGLFLPLLVALGASLLYVGCARPPKPRIDNLYRGLNENLPRFDPRLLEGRRIVVDPGHGGHFPGTHGPEGLDESAVNLGVALYLWGLLREAGADVYLTRSADRDLLSGPDSTVAADLRVRVDMVDSVRPDIVVSIHHNAQPERDPAKNVVETYFKIGDPASRDLAFAVHRHLMRNLGIEQGEVRPGNYYILREVSVPAILGEGSYLTHPPVEANLRLSEKQRLEAEAYFLGVLEFFSRGTPVIEPMAPCEGDRVVTEVPVLEYAVTDVGGLGIDPAAVEMVVNGVSVHAQLDPAGTTVCYPFPWDSPNGTYHVALSVRNVLGNSSPLHEQSIELNLPAEHAVFDTYPGSIPRDGGTIFARARLLDRRGLSVADGQRIAVAVWQRGAANAAWVPLGEGGEEEAVCVKSGIADFFIEAPGGATELRIAIECASDSTRGGSAQESERPFRFEHVIPGSPAKGPPARSIAVMSRLSRAPLEEARFVTAGGRLDAQFRSDRFVLLDTAGVGEVWVYAPGYRPAVLAERKPEAAAPSDTIWLDPWHQGKLAGRRIVVNPTGDVPGQSVRGRLGLSGAHVNLQVARYLRDYLEAAGALVQLARWSEETPLDRDVVASTNRFGADQYVEIRCRGGEEDAVPSVRTFHFPGSARGRAVATAVGEALGLAIEAEVDTPLDAVTYPLQQTSCPAIIVEPPSIGRMDEELRLSEPWYQRRQAYGIFCGILRYAGVDSAGTLRVVLVPDSSVAAPPETFSNWLVTLDDTWRLLTSPEDSSARFDCAPPGTHRLFVRRGDRALGPVEVVVQPGRIEEVRIAVPTRP
jgi:N-acetylmuramoyl-L-alanine amidase